MTKEEIRVGFGDRCFLSLLSNGEEHFVDEGEIDHCLDKLLEEIDVDHNGYIDYIEFL